MKKMKMLILAVVCMGVFAICGVADAITFTISDIQLSNPVGNGESFIWSVAPITDSSITFNIANVGDSYTFTYGIFTPMNYPSGTGHDVNDSFTSSFSIKPPDPVSTQSEIGSSMAHFWVDATKDFVNIQFGQDLFTVNFGNGGIYEVLFLDPDKSYGTNPINLQAKVTLTSAPVPEPGTIILLGAGLLGFGFYGRRRLKA